MPLFQAKGNRTHNSLWKCSTWNAEHARERHSPEWHEARRQSGDWRSRDSTAGLPAAIDKQRVSGDKIRGGTCQEHRGADQIGRLCKSAKFDPAEQSLRARFVFAERTAYPFRERLI